MYENHFGFSETPFAITPDPRFLYMSRRHQDALAHLKYGLFETSGFVLLTGEIGTGKTALCRCLLEQLPESMDAALILNPRQSALELVANICDELHIGYPPGNQSIKLLIDLLNSHLLKSHGAGRRTVLIVDEAQNLSDPVLEQIRLLTNLETTKQKLLQILLVGQPELRGMLARPELRQLAQRITARYHMTPLSKKETAAYVRHRLSVAGVQRPLFTGPSTARLHNLTHGVPRLINILCDRALLGAYANNRPVVTTAIINRAARETLPQTPPPTRRLATPLLLSLLLAGMALSLYHLPPWRGQTAPETAKHPLPSSDKTTVPEEPAGETVEQNLLKPLMEEKACRSGDAVHGLFRRWGREYQVQTGSSPCELAEKQGLRCLYGAGTWNNLRRYNRPAIIEMQRPDGRWRQLLVDRIDEATVRLSCGHKTATASFEQADPFWYGEYLLLWHPPGARTQLRLGDRGDDVTRLREQLNRALKENLPAEQGMETLFDTGLEGQVKRFQRTHSLQVDGIAGKETLILLNSVAGDALIPRLTSD